MRFLTLFAIFISTLAIVFALQNSTQVLIQFFQWKSLQSMGLVLLFTLATGVLLGLLISLPTSIRRLAQISQLKQTLRQQALDLERNPRSPRNGVPTDSPADVPPTGSSPSSMESPGHG